MVLSGMLRAVDPGAGASTGGVGIWLDIALASGSSVFPQVIDIPPSALPAVWTPYRALYTLPADAVMIRPFTTVRTNVTAGTFQVCGGQLSIIGSMPLP